MTVFEWIAFVLAVLIMIVGTLGTVVPVLPGLPLVWIAMLLFGVAEKFQRVDGVFLAVALAVVVAAEVADYGTRAWGARRYGASRAGGWGAVVGALAGLFFMPVGLLLGPFLGVLIAELLAGRTTDESLRAGWGGLLGVLGSIVVKMTVALGMIFSFIVKAL